MSAPARHESTCPECGTRIHLGDPIRHDEDHDTSVHVVSTTTYRDTRAKVRRVPTPIILRDNGFRDAGKEMWSWRASVPGKPYLVGDGLHFHTWDDAMDYATGKGRAK